MTSSGIRPSLELASADTYCFALSLFAFLFRNLRKASFSFRRLMTVDFISFMLSLSALCFAWAFFKLSRAFCILLLAFANA
jgi:hypothetical protein